MKRKIRMHALRKLALPVLLAAVLIVFINALSSISKGHAEEEQRQLEDILRQTAVACYAIEGSYPSDLQYLEDHYGVQINHDRYTVIYSPIASNLMPDITVIKK